MKFVYMTWGYGRYYIRLCGICKYLLYSKHNNNFNNITVGITNLQKNIALGNLLK